MPSPERDAAPAGALGPVEFTRLVADRTRLALLGALARAPAAASDLASATGVPARSVLGALARLQHAGLVRAGDDGVYSLVDTALSATVRALPRSDPPSAALLSVLDPGEAEVAARFFSGRRIVELPAQESKRRLVLRVVVEEFEPGRYYPERDLVRILERFHPDHAALRRYLVEDGLLSRDNATATYWRGGGPAPGGGPAAPPRA